MTQQFLLVVVLIVVEGTGECAPHEFGHRHAVPRRLLACSVEGTRGDTEGDGRTGVTGDEWRGDAGTAGFAHAVTRSGSGASGTSVNRRCRFQAIARATTGSIRPRLRRFTG